MNVKARIWRVGVHLITPTRPPCASLRLGVMVRAQNSRIKTEFSFLTLKQEESGNVG